MAAMAQTRWFAAANCDLPGLAASGTSYRAGEVRVHTNGLSVGPPPMPPYEIDVRAMAITPTAEGSHPTTPSTATSIRVDEDGVLVRASILNENAVYVAINRRRERWAFFTDLFLAPLLLPALDLPVELRDGEPDYGAGQTLLRHVERVPHAAVHEARRLRHGWTLRTVQPTDPLWRLRRPGRTNALEAGEAQLRALEEEIGAVARRHRGARVATLLSGGIDSGTVTYLATKQGLPVTPYSAGTPWGDEFDDAAELTGHLGLPLHTVALDEERIIAAIPRAIRGLGVHTAEVVEVALTATALLHGDEIPRADVLLTGYGSDLINAGLYRPFEAPEELIEQTLSAIHGTRFSNELSNLLPMSTGRAVYHPFWAWPVMRVALDTAPRCKVHGGREKYHLRLAMSKRVPERIAWRTKVAVHHGGALQEGVAKLLAARAPGVRRQDVYRSCFGVLLQLAGEGNPDGWDPMDVYEAGIAAVSR